jgi:hypothetical protein
VVGCSEGNGAAVEHRPAPGATWGGDIVAQTDSRKGMNHGKPGELQPDTGHGKGPGMGVASVMASKMASVAGRLHVGREAACVPQA